jgi:hypothetical protein
VLNIAEFAWDLHQEIPVIKRDNNASKLPKLGAVAWIE